MIANCPHCGTNLHLIVRTYVTFWIDSDGSWNTKEVDDEGIQKEDVQYVECVPCKKVWFADPDVAAGNGTKAVIDELGIEITSIQDMDQQGDWYESGSR